MPFKQVVLNKAALTSLANVVCATAKTQAAMAGLMLRYLPNLSAADKQALQEAEKLMNMEILDTHFSVMQLEGLEPKQVQRRGG